MEFRMKDVLDAMPKSQDEIDNMDDKARAEYEAYLASGKPEAVHQSVVFGHDHKTIKGIPQEQGLGARGRETMNHFQSVRRYEGEDAYWTEVARIWKDSPKHAEKLAKQGLPKPRPTPKAASASQERA